MKGKYSQNKKIFHLSVPQGPTPIPPPSLHFWVRGCVLNISVTFISEENQIGIIVDLLLKLGRGNSWSNRQDYASGWEG